MQPYFSTKSSSVSLNSYWIPLTIFCLQHDLQAQEILELVISSALDALENQIHLKQIETAMVDLLDVFQARLHLPSLNQSCLGKERWLSTILSLLVNHPGVNQLPNSMKEQHKQIRKAQEIFSAQAVLVKQIL